MPWPAPSQKKKTDVLIKLVEKSPSDVHNNDFLGKSD
jgi:hypothetical protein